MLDKINKFAPIAACLLSGAALFYAYAAYDAADSAGYSAEEASSYARRCEGKASDAIDAVEKRCR